MASIAKIGVGTQTDPQLLAATGGGSLTARVSDYVKEVFSWIAHWAVTLGAIVGVVVVIKVIAASPLIAVAAAIGAVMLYKNRQKIALLFSLWITVFKDFIGLKKHAWFHPVGDHIVLGGIPLQGKNHPQKLQKMNVTGVLCLAEEEELKTEGVFVHPVKPETWHAMSIAFRHIPSSEVSSLSPTKIDEAVAFIHARAQKNEKTYVHDAQGTGRGALVVACYLMKHQNLSAKGAIDFIKKRRPAVVLTTEQRGRIYEYADHLEEVSKPKPS